MAYPFPALDGSAPKTQQFNDTPEFGIDTSKRYTATMDTSMGTMVIALDAINAPITVNNFVFLAGYKYYEGVIFHRMAWLRPGVPFVAQGGDPTGTGRGNPGYRFEDEPVKLSYEYGSVAMANSGRDTNGSQFFIFASADATDLDRNYNHFGKVVKGLDVVDAMVRVPCIGERPKTDVVINSVTITVAD